MLQFVEKENVESSTIGLSGNASDPVDESLFAEFWLADWELAGVFGLLAFKAACLIALAWESWLQSPSELTSYPKIH